MELRETEIKIPERWERTTLEHVSKEIARYPTFYGMEHLDSGIPVIRGEHLNEDGRISHDWDDYWYVSEEVSDKFPRTIVDVNDLIMSVRGSIGKLGLIDEPLKNAQVSPNCIRISIRKEVCFPKFLLYYLKSSTGQSLIQGHVSATTIKTIKASLIKKTLVPLPPLNEQINIVERIEKLFTQLYAGAADLNRVQVKLARYKASVLKAACESRLVPTEAELARAEGRDYESGEELLQRILVGRKKKWEEEQRAKGKDPSKMKYKEPEPPDAEDSPELPEGWVWATIDQLTSHVTSGSRGWAKYYSEEGSLFVRVGNFDNLDTDLDLSNPVFVNAPSSAEAERTRLGIGDLLMTITADVGKISLVDERAFQWGKAYINQHVSLIRPLEIALSRYLAYALESDIVQSQIQKKQYGATKKGLGLEDVKSLTLPFPPPDEQNRIIAEIERKISVMREIELCIENNIRRSERLRQAILRWAFEGKLIRQDSEGMLAGTPSKGI
jgi:type I restriction enzyme S subunit